jgi:RimJ/RimL family protein N-acetyltransferase
MCRDSIGKGYGTLAIGEMLLLAFEELQLNRVFLTVKKDNTRAMRAYEKNGFTLVGMDGNQYKYQILNRKKPVMLEFVQRGVLG